MTEYESVIQNCIDDLKNENLSNEKRRYLIGKRYEAEKQIASIKKREKNFLYSKKSFENKLSPVEKAKNTTAAKVAKEYGLTPQCIRIYELYAKAIDVISSAHKDFAEVILSGEIKASFNYIEKLSTLSSSKIIEIGDQIMENKATNKFLKDDTNSMLSEHLQDVEKTPKIKIMPKHDPNSSITALTLTIPSWINMLKRTKNYTKLSETELESREKLLISLALLEQNTQEIITWARGECDE